MKWEYRIVKHTSGSQNDRTHNLIRFNEIGQEGWELVSVDNGIAYFKREIRNNKPESNNVYTYETVQDGYVVYDSLGKKLDPWQLVSILDNCLALSGSL